MRKNLDNELESMPLVVRSSNELTNSRFMFSELELNIVFYLLYLMRQNVRVYEFTIKELMDFRGSERYNGASLLDAAKSLVAKQISVEDDKDHWLVVNLFSKFEYKEGLLTVSLNPEAFSLFWNTKVKFTQFQLESAFKLEGKYNKRLYWILCRWKKKGSCEFSLKDLRELLGVDENDAIKRGRKKKSDVNEPKYKNSHFKAIVDKACRCISDNTELYVTSEWTTVSRQLSNVRFTIRTKRFDTQFVESPDKAALKNLVASAYSFFTEEQVEQMWSLGCTADKFKKLVQKANETIRNNKTAVSEPHGYLVTCFVNAGYLKPCDSFDEKRQKMKEAARKEQEDYLNQRNLAIQMVRQAKQAGTDLAIFQHFIDMYKISEKDLRD